MSMLSTLCILGKLVCVIMEKHDWIANKAIRSPVLWSYSFRRRLRIVVTHQDTLITTIYDNFYRPQRSWFKAMFLHVSVILFTGGGGGGGIPACIAGGIRPTPRGKLRGLAKGVSRPTTKGKVEGSGLGGLQAHTQGGSWGVWPMGVSSPTPGGGLQAHTWAGSLGPHARGCIPACTKADSPMATAAGGTHPTGMHSCLNWVSMFAKTKIKLSTTLISRKIGSLTFIYS